MAVFTAFNQNGQTVAITAAQTAPTPVQVTSNYSVSGTYAQLQYRILNTGSVVVFLGVAKTSSEATTHSAVVTSVGDAIPLLPGTDEIFTFPGDCFFTASIATATTATIYITPGEGL